MDLLYVKHRLLGRPFREGESTGGGSNETASSGYSSAADSNAAYSQADQNTAATAGWSADGNQTPAETSRLPSQSSGDNTIANGNVDGVNTSQPNNMWSSLATVGSFIPGPVGILSRTFLAAQPFGTLAHDLSDPNQSVGDAIGKFAKTEILNKAAGIINGQVAQAVGPGAANMMNAYGTATTLSNAVAGTNAPTSVGGYMVSQLGNGSQPSTVDGNTYGTPDQYGGFTSGSHTGATQIQPDMTSTQTPTVAPTAPTQANGVIGNYLDWFNQGARKARGE